MGGVESNPANPNSLGGNHVGQAAQGEVVKCSMFPCTAIMYWLGSQDIVDLRESIRAKRGAAFSLKAFHDELLSFGSIPVPLVRRIMTAPED